MKTTALNSSVMSTRGEYLVDGFSSLPLPVDAILACGERTQPTHVGFWSPTTQEVVSDS